MRTRTKLEKVIFCASMIGLGLSLAGTDRCQQNYSVAGQLTTTPSGTDTPTPTPTDTGGDIVTRTPTTAATATPQNTSVVPTATVTPTSTSVSSTASSNALVNSLAALATKTTEDSKSEAASASAAKSAANGDGNWLGKSYSKDNKDDATGEHDAVDSDDDGFADWVEEKFGSDPEDGGSTPAIPLTTRLADRLSNSGATVTLESLQNDIATGQKRHLHDSDGDGLPDDDELSVGSDPLNQDSDGDGIWDGREVELGTDPVNPEWH